MEPFLVSVRDSFGIEMPSELSNPFISAADILTEEAGDQKMNLLTANSENLLTANSECYEEIYSRVRQRVTFQIRN